MIDHEQILEVIENDLLAAGLNPEGYLIDGYCKECARFYQIKDKEYGGCRRGNITNYLTGNGSACRGFRERND